MRFLVSLFVYVLISGSALACSSDCSQCHKLPKDRDHIVLSTCTTCHSEHSESALKSSCGADCFDCHSYSKVMKTSPAHKVLVECVSCHKTLREKELPEPLRKFLGGN